MVAVQGGGEGGLLGRGKKDRIVYRIAPQLRIVTSYLLGCDVT